MKKVLFITLLVTLFCLCFTADESDVLVLDGKNFQETLKKHEYVFVEFYAPWCGHCKQLAPEYEALATKMKGSNIVIAKVDCDANRELAESNEVQGFPTLKLFKNGAVFKEYDSGRTTDAMVNWLKKKTGPVAQSLANDAEVRKFVETTPSSVVGYFKSKEDPAYQTFIKAVSSERTFEDFPAGEVFDEKLEAAYVKLFREFEPNQPLETKDFDGLVKFVKENGYPLVEEISANNFQRFVDAGVPLGVTFLDYEKAEEKDKLIKTIEKVAGQLKGKFSWSYSNGKDYKDQLEAMGGESDKLPAVAAMNLEERKNYPYQGEITEEGLLKWAQGILDGSVKPFFRSDPIPEKQESPVYVVVGKSYESVVLDKTKDVLLEFYAPWCGHCKQLAPKYEKLAKKYQGIDNLVIAKIDATTNDTPYPVEGFPTLVFFPATNKETPVPYEGDRSINDLANFIKDQATVSKEAVAKLESAKTTTTKTEEKKDEL